MADQQTVTINLVSKAETAGVKQTVDSLVTLRGAVERVGLKIFALKEIFTTAFHAIESTLGAPVDRIRQSINFADDIAKTAQEAGRAVSTFSALAYAGNLNRASQQALVSSSRELSKWLDSTGQVGRDLTDVFFEQADAVSKMADGDEKLRYVQERFGKNGQELIPLLNQGSAAIRQQMEEARIFGLVIGPEFARRASDFNDNISRIRAFLSGLFNRAADALLPQLVEVSDGIVRWARENAERIGNLVTDAANALIHAYQQNRLGEFLALAIESGIGEGFRLGIRAAEAAIRMGLERLLSVDFLIFAAKVGRMLAAALLSAVKIPVDVLSAGFEYLVFRFYNQFIDTNVKAAGFVLDLYTKAFNSIGGKIAAASPVMALTFKPLQFDREKFQRDIKAATQVDTQSFGDLFVEKQKQSSEATKNLLGYFDEQIEKTKQLLTIGEADVETTHAKVSALEKLIELLKHESELREQNAALEKEHVQTAQPGLTEGRAKLRAQEIDDAIRLRELDVERLHTRGLFLEGADRTVGTLQQEAQAIRDQLEAMKQLVAEKEKLHDDMLRSGLISTAEARESELKDAQDLLRIQQQLVQLKEQTNDFTFFEALSRGIQDLSDQFNHLGASAANVLVRGIGSAIDTVSNGIWQIVDGTATWGDLFRQVGREIISGLIRIAIQEIILDNLKKGIMMAWKAMVSAFRAADVAEHNATEAAKTPVLATNATLSSIESYGVAVAIGVAAIAAILASVGAFEKGGVVKGGRQMIQVNEAGTESVLNARATALLGEERINALNAGTMTVRDLEAALAASIALPGDAASMRVNARSGPVQERQPQASNQQFHIALFDNRTHSAVREFMESAAGKAYLIDLVRNNKTEIGIRG